MRIPSDNCADCAYKSWGWRFTSEWRHHSWLRDSIGSTSSIADGCALQRPLLADSVEKVGFEFHARKVRA
ncbi:hypothetical protein CXB41_22570 [Pseudomonas syringae pv. syringae]|nr:hypothetical protein CXB41_22570 [Pseudomonas syringae pv. syringae]